MARILVLGAAGFIGKHLIPKLLAEGHFVRGLFRNPGRLNRSQWSGVEIFQGDLLIPDSLPDIFRDIDIVYYLVHSMSDGDRDFEESERRAAQNVSEVASKSGVKRIIYLGGLGNREKPQSRHLRSRHEVGDILRHSGLPVTEFRAAIIIGSGGASFEIIHHLVNRLPVMICPRWVYTKTQPIGIDDVIQYLAESVRGESSTGKVIDIGGPEVVTYGEMMMTVARVLELKRLLVSVPVLTPRLSSYWVNLVTPASVSLARTLIDSLKYETICENDQALRLFGIKPLSLETVVRQALAPAVPDHAPEGLDKFLSGIDSSHIYKDTRIVEIDASVATVDRVVTSAGGANGWFFANWLWTCRGFLDRLVGGVGMRRGRPHRDKVAAGECLDFWRVEEYTAERRFLLRAEMKVWGRAWLEFRMVPKSESRTQLVQTAYYYPKGLTGNIYWFSVKPIHAVVFAGMIKAIARRAETA